MGYPEARDYERVMSQPPARRPLSPDLGPIVAAEIVRPPAGNGLLWGAGGFAVVYRCRASGGQGAALRLPISAPADDTTARYSGLAGYREQHPLECLVSAQYFPRGVEIKNEWYPAFTMDWVDGTDLKTWADRQLQAGRNDAVRHLADQWQRVVAALQDAKIAHGDLQHDNVLVTERGELRLVDYDTIYFPGMTGQEIVAGREGYVHPRYLNKPRPFGEHMDTFSALVILLSLRALAAIPGLLGASQENLLFTARDLGNPGSSATFKQLRQASDPDVVQWAAILQKACISAPDAPLAFPRPGPRPRAIPPQKPAPIPVQTQPTAPMSGKRPPAIPCKRPDPSTSNMADKGGSRPPAIARPPSQASQPAAGSQTKRPAAIPPPQRPSQAPQPAANAPEVIRGAAIPPPLPLCRKARHAPEQKRSAALRPRHIGDKTQE